MWKPGKQSLLVTIIFVLVIVAGVLIVLASWRLWPFSSTDERTEDAYVHGRTTVISPQVSGYVRRVLVDDFAVVAANQVLVLIDQASYRQAVEVSEGDLAAKRAQLANNAQTAAQARAAVLVQDAAVGSARATLVKADEDMRRSDDLVRDGSLSEREAELNRATFAQAAAMLTQAQAQRASAVEQVRSVEVNKGALLAAVQGSQASLDTAFLNLSHTVIHAPEAGQLSDIGVRPGQYVTNGTALLYLVPPSFWVTANYKEGQTRHMIPGQPAWFAVDALGGAHIRGHLERISPAAGAEFAVLKPDNATGNFTKVPQRIPMRITVDAGQPLAARLRAGMSVEVHVNTSGWQPGLADGRGGAR